MEVNTISIIEPVGGHGGMDYYDYGLAYGIGSNGVKVRYYTSADTKRRSFTNVDTFYTFGKIWHQNMVRKIVSFYKGYIISFLDSKRNGTKLVHLHFFHFYLKNFLVLLLARIVGMKIVVTVHDVDSFHNKSNKIIESLSYKLIHKIIVHNKSSEQKLINKNFTLPPIATIPHGNYLPFISRNTKKKDRSENRTLNLLFFGQIKEVKGLDILIEAMAIVAKETKSIKLTIAGRAWKTDLEKYELMIMQLGLENIIETHFRFIPDDEISYFFEDADLVVLPYREIYQSGVLLLSFSYGRTVIASDLPAFSELIDDGYNGFLFEAGNSIHLATKIIEASKNRPRIKQMTQKVNQQIEQDFDWGKIGKKTIEFYNK